MGGNGDTVREIFGRGVSFLPLLFLLLFFYLPLGLILLETFSDRSAFGEVWSSPYYWRIIRFTLLQALASTLFSLFLGLPGAYFLGRYDFPGRKFVKSLTTLPFVLPSILVVLGFVLFFGNSGGINRLLMGLFGLEEPPLRTLYSFKAIILAHGFYNFPIVMRMVGTPWRNLPANQHHAALSLGAGGPRIFRTLTLPQLLPGILSAASLVFLFCFMSFAIILVLGGGPRYSTLEVEVYRLAQFTLDIPAANALGLTGAVITLGLLGINLSLEKKASTILEKTGAVLAPKTLRLRGTSSGSFRGFPLSALGLSVYLVFLTILLLGPLLSVAVYSLQDRASWGGKAAWSLKWYKQLFLHSGGAASGVFLQALRNSLGFALAAVAIALPLGTILTLRNHGRRNLGGLRSFYEMLLMLPLGISPVILGLGYLKALKFLPPALKGGAWAVIGAHAVIGYPFVIRSVSSSLHEIPSLLRQAAASLGASPRRILLTVELPLIRGGIFTGAAFAFVLSLGEINATILLARPGQTTIPLAIYRLIGAYNLYGACVLGTLLMALCGLAFFIIDHFEEAMP